MFLYKHDFDIDSSGENKVSVSFSLRCASRSPPYIQLDPNKQNSNLIWQNENGINSSLTFFCKSERIFTFYGFLVLPEQSNISFPEIC